MPEQTNEQLLNERLKYLGFQDYLNKDLAKAMGENQQRFQLDFTAEFERVWEKKDQTQEKDKSQVHVVDFKLDFEKKEGKKDYELLQYTATLRDPNDSDLNKSHRFELYNGRGVTGKEAFNLLDGRAVAKSYKKDDVIQTGWLKINFSQDKDTEKNQFAMDYYPPKYNFNVEKALDRIGVKGMNYEDTAKRIIRSLERGDITPVMLNDGRKTLVTANPGQWNVIEVDRDGQRLAQGGMKQHKDDSQQKQEGKSEAQADESNKAKITTSDRAPAANDKEQADAKNQVQSQDTGAQKTRSEKKEQEQGKSKAHGKSRGARV